MRKGIIRDVPVGVSEDDIVLSSNIPFKIISAKRFSRKVNFSATDTNSDGNNNNDKFNYVPTKSVSISFEGQRLPKYITMFHVSYPVTPYVPRVSQCHSYYRYGHIKLNCKGFTRCVNC